MEKIVIIHFPPKSIEFPPLQEAILAMDLEQAGFNVSVVDLNLSLRLHAKDRFQSAWYTINQHHWHDRDRLARFVTDNDKFIDQTITSIVQNQPTLVLADCSYPKEVFGCECIKRLKEQLPDLKVVLYGFSCLLEAQQKALQQLSGNLIDIFLTDPVPSIPMTLLHKLNKAENIVEADGDHEEENQDETSSFFPTFKKFKRNWYRGQILPVSLGSGCSGTCLFCKKRIHNKTCKLRPVAEIIEELSSHIIKLRTNRFHFCGAPINADPQLAFDLYNGLIENKLDISWSAEATAVPALPDSLLKMMKESGCHTLDICAVSGSDSILSRFQAGFTTSDIDKLLDRANQADIRCAISLISGFPGEYRKELLESFDFISRNGPPAIYAVKDFHDLHVYPSTRLYKDREEYDIRIDDELLVNSWSCDDGNNFFQRKLLQNQLHQHVRHNHIHYQPGDLFGTSEGFKGLQLSGYYRDIKYLLNNIFYPLHIYRSEILAKLVASYASRRTVVVEKNEIDYSFINGIEDGRKAFIGPESVHIDITNRCNFNCIACWDRSPLIREKGVKDEYLQKTLSYEQITGFIDDLARLGGARFIKFTGGGEPMMHPRFKDILRYLRKKDKYIEIDINTNFSLMNEELLKLMIDLQVNLLTVSLWAASPEVYTKTHPNQKAKGFEKIVANLKRITASRKDKILRIFIHNVLMSHNHHEVEAMLELALDVGADEVHFTIVDPVPGRTDSLLLSHEQHQIVTQSLKKIKPLVDKHNQYIEPETGRTIHVTNFHEFYAKMCQPEVEEGVYDKRAADKIPCYIGWTFTRVMADGRVIPCCKGHRLPLGNLSDQRFIDIWNSPRYQTFRHNGKTLSKSEPYFSVMGDDGAGLTGCLNCDNIIHNLVMHDKVLCKSDMVQWFLHKLDQWWEKRRL